MSWRAVKLGEITTMKYGKLPPKVSSCDASFPIFTGYRIAGFCDEFLYDEPQVIVVARGVGGTGDVKMSPEKSWITNLSIVLCVDSNRIDKRFLCYRLQQEPLKDKLNTGAAQAQITIENLRPYQITIPIVSTQRRIADIVSAYDDLIENNRRRMALLEESARLLYREWFVRLRFPGHEHTRLVNGIPDGWEVRPLGQCAKFLSGGTPSKARSDFWEGDIPWVSSGEMKAQRIHDVALHVTAQAVEDGSRLVPPNTILAVVRGMSLAKEFRVCITARTVAFNQDLKAFACEPGVDPVYLFNALLDQRDQIRDRATEASHGTKKLDTPVLASVAILVPPQTWQARFREFVDPLNSQWDNLHQQTEKLRAARDMLLPRLMSGEISV